MSNKGTTNQPGLIPSIQELEQIILSKQFHKMGTEEQTSILYQRWRQLNEQFEYTDEQVKQIRRVNEIFLRKMHEVYDNVLRVKQILDKQLAQGEVVFNQYNVEGKLCVEIEYPDDRSDASKELLMRLADYSTCLWQVDAVQDDEMDRVNEMLGNCNWDIGVFNPLKPQSIHICYATYSLFNNDYELSLSDMIRIQEEDVKWFVQIHL